MNRTIAKGALLLLSTCLFSTARAEQAEESVLLVDMAYRQGRWQAKPIAVLPCPGPSKPDSLSPTRSMLQLRNRDGKVLYRHFLENPRLVLVEDPKASAGLLKDTRFTLRIPIRAEGKRAVPLKEVFSFDFFENGLESKTPAVSLRLDKAIPTLSALQSAAKRPACQIIAPRVDNLPILKTDRGDALSPESLASLIKEDKGLLVRWGVETGVTPDELRKIVSQKERGWSAVGLDKKEVEALLGEYADAYAARKAVKP